MSVCPTITLPVLSSTGPSVVNLRGGATCGCGDGVGRSGSVVGGVCGVCAEVMGTRSPSNVCLNTSLSICAADIRRGRSYRINISCSGVPVSSPDNASALCFHASAMPCP